MNFLPASLEIIEIPRSPLAFDARACFEYHGRGIILLSPGILLFLDLSFNVRGLMYGESA
jgi:hypothetical protein